MCTVGSAVSTDADQEPAPVRMDGSEEIAGVVVDGQDRLIVFVKAALHDTDTDSLADILAKIVARMSACRASRCRC